MIEVFCLSVRSVLRFENFVWMSSFLNFCRIFKATVIHMQFPTYTPPTSILITTYLKCKSYVVCTLKIRLCHSSAYIFAETIDWIERLSHFSLNSILLGKKMTRLTQGNKKVNRSLFHKHFIWFHRTLANVINSLFLNSQFTLNTKQCIL